jgi:hypothetical protein
MLHVVLVHTPTLQARGDFEQIAKHIEALDGHVAAFVANNTESNDELNTRIASAPTLTFSPVQLDRFRPSRGRVYEGGMVDKLSQYQELVRIGVATPRTALLEPGRIFPPEIWGEHIVLKPLSPMFQSNGQRIYRMATAKLNYDLSVRGMFDQYHVKGGTLVQQFVNTGPHLEYHRVLTLFGTPLYAMTTRLKHPIKASSATYPTGTTAIATQSFSPKDKIAEMLSEERYLELASSAFAAFPNRALQGIDIIRDCESDQLYVLEMNLGGNIWHFSSGMIGAINDSRRRAEFQRKKVNQFGAFGRVATLLHARALAEAV